MQAGRGLGDYNGIAIRGRKSNQCLARWLGRAGAGWGLEVGRLPQLLGVPARSSPATANSHSGVQAGSLAVPFAHGAWGKARQF